MRIRRGFTKLVYLSWSAALLCVVGFAGRASADSTDYEGIYAKLIGGLNFALDSDFDGSGPDAFPSGEAALDTGATVGLGVGYRFR